MASESIETSMVFSTETNRDVGSDPGDPLSTPETVSSPETATVTTRTRRRIRGVRPERIQLSEDVGRNERVWDLRGNLERARCCRTLLRPAHNE